MKQPVNPYLLAKTKDQKLVRDALIEYVAFADIRESSIDKDNAKIGLSAFYRLLRKK